MRARARLRMTRGLVCSVLVLLAAGTGVASAATAPYQLSYKSYNLFDGWRPDTWDKCSMTNTIYGSEPAADGKYPVFIYLHGTLGDYKLSQEGQRVTDLAAQQGFEAAAFTYSLVTPTQKTIDGNAKCMFDQQGQPGNAIAKICARPKADCSRGFVVAGMSAGGAIAVRAKNFNAGVQAVWAMGVNGPDVAAGIAAPLGTRVLPDDRLRIVDGQTDLQVKSASGATTMDFSKVKAMTGQACTAFNCLRPDGSGYYAVANSEVADGVADHCFWMKVNKFVPTNSCTWLPTFDPGFLPPSARPWSLTTNLDWLRAKLG
jgi:poly(3-hydroxybutyrate) depolymerase